MSNAEHDQFEGGRSSVKVTRNAKGDPQWEIKIRVGDTKEEVDAARKLAVETYESLQDELLEPKIGAGT